MALTKNSQIDLNGNEMILDADGDTTITADTDDRIDFRTAGSDKIHINGDGNFLLGTTSPSASEVRIDVRYSANPIIQVRDTTNDVSLWMQATDSVATLVAPQNGPLAFGVGASQAERMRIDHNGKILMKLTSSISDETLQVRTNQAIGYGILVDETDSGGGTFMRFRVNGSIVGQIYGNGSATTYATSSDYRLKENITYNWDATTRLKNLKPARFNFIVDADKTVDGFLAHEVSDIVPEAITGEKDGVDSEGEPIYQSIDHSKLVPLLVKTIQELEARITTLEGG